MKKSLGVILITFLFLVLPGKIFAASISYTESPSSFNFSPNDEITFRINLSINTSNDTNYYLRGVFYKKGTTNYCGFTWNGSTFFSGPYSTNEGWKQFLKATIQDNKWEGEIKVKIDSDDTGCRDSGEYGFKIQRFTETGSSTFDTQEEKLFTFTIPTPTPTPTPTEKPTPTPKPIRSTSSGQAKTPTPTKSGITTTTEKSLNSATKDTSTPSSEVLPANNLTSSNSNDSQVMGVRNSVPESSEDKTNKNQIGKLIIILGGVLLTSSFGILLFKKYKKEKELSFEEV